MKENSLAQELAGIALRQLQSSYLFKLPRINEIRKFRRFRLNQIDRQLRIRYNAPIPIFSGMIDTLLADLDDAMILKYEEQDPSDWLACKKANVALQLEMESMRPGAQWNQKFRAARDECVMSGRATMQFDASSENGFETCLETIPFEDFFFEPKGGPQLEKHVFRGRDNRWRTKKSIQDDRGGIYDAKGVDNLLKMSGMEYKSSPVWENYDFANRYLPLGLSAEANNYVGEEMFHLVEWELLHKGIYWYLVFEPYSLTVLRCDKLTDVNSSGLSHWMSFASHPDLKNFASKGFADDLYPVARMMTDMLNEDMENIRRRNSSARAFDKDMFTDVAALDLAMMGRDRLVPADTKGGAKRIAEGIYHFETPEISGTLDKMKYLEEIVQRNLGVQGIQQGEEQPSNKNNGVMFTEMGAISKRLSFMAKPIIEVGQELGMRYFGGLKDYMKEPLSIKLLGEDGFEWTELKRRDLSIKRDFKIVCASQNHENQMNQMNHENKMKALEAVLEPAPNGFIGNLKIVNEHKLRQGGWSEAEIALILDPTSDTNKEVIAKTSEIIQLLMNGRIPPIYYGADAYFMNKLYDFIYTHQGDPKVKKNFQKFIAYWQSHTEIAKQNEGRRAQKDIMAQGGGAAPQPEPSANAGQPQPVMA